MKLDPKNTVKNMKHLRIEHLFNNPKKFSNCDQHPKKMQIFEIQNPKKYSVADPLSVNIPSSPPGEFYCTDRLNGCLGCQ